MNPELYPLTLEPVITEKFWGRSGSSSLDSDDSSDFKQGTMLMATDHSKVLAGPLAGRSLGQLRQLWGSLLVGSLAGGDPDTPVAVELKLKRTGDMALAVALTENSLWYVLAADEDSSLNAGFRVDIDLAEAASEAEGDPGIWAEFMTEYPVEAGQCLYLPRLSPLLLGSGLTVAQIGSPARVSPHWPLAGTGADSFSLSSSIPQPVWLKTVAVGPGQGEFFRDTKLTVRLLAVSQFSSVVSQDSATFIWPLFGQGRIRTRGPAPATRLQPGRVVMLPAGLGRYAIGSRGTMGFLLIEAR